MRATSRRFRPRRAGRCGTWLRSVRARLFPGIAGIALLFISGAEAGLQREIDCLARNIYFEARFEPEEGRLAVAHVVLNRVRDRRWPGTPCRVIADGFPEAGILCQFSWYCDGTPNRPADDQHWREAKQMADLVYWGHRPDPTEGALWYHADYVDPQWRHALRRGAKIGHHIFYFDAAQSAVPEPTPDLSETP